MSKLNFWRLLFRSWFYFRVGYGTYIAFLIGFASNLVVIYKLGIVGNKLFESFFYSLTVFSIVALVVTVPICISAGLYHMKRTGAFAADASVSLEANPYIYRIIPGKEREVFLPLWVITVRSLAKVLDRQQAMTQEERRELDEALEKANALLEGRAIGLPQSPSQKAPSSTKVGD